MKTEKNEQLGLRVSTETKEEYKEFCDVHKCAQGDGLALLLQLQKLQEAAIANPKRAEILNAFQSKVESLVTLMEASLVLAEEAGNQAKAGFALQLEQNAHLISSLQETIETKDAFISTLSAENVTVTAERDSFKQKVDELTERNAYIHDQLQDKNQRIASLTEEIAEIKDLPKRYQALLEDVNELRRENKALSDQLKDAEIAHAGEIRRLEEAKHQAQLEAAHLKPQGGKA